MLKNALMLTALLLPACFAQAQDYTAGKMVIHDPWSMALPPNAPAVAAYFTIQNEGDTPDRLLSVETPVAGQAQLHEHVHADGLMKMKQVQSVAIAQQASVKFAPMTWHVMLLDLKDRSKLVVGQQFPLTLHFEKAGDIEVQVQVRSEPSGHHQH